MSIPIIPRASPLPPDVSTAPRLIGTTTAFLFLALLVFSARILSRVRPVPNLGWDDHTMTVAVVFALISWSFVVASIPYGAGRHMYYLSQASNSGGGLMVFAGQTPWLWANTLVKISVAFTFLRIKQTTTWRWFLYEAIAAQIASAIGATVTIFTQCKPLQALWDTTIPGSQCL
ncbi:hypothetical protein AOQ84DRAFT_306095, partial [Glonium stellatum]